MMSLNCDNAMCYLTLAAQVMLDEDINLFDSEFFQPDVHKFGEFAGPIYRDSRLSGQRQWL